MGIDQGDVQQLLDPGHFTQNVQSPGTQYRNQAQIDQYIQQGMAGANQAAPQVGPMSADQQAQFRQMQMLQAQQLQGVASGQQQGAGELAVQRQMQNAQAAQQAMARMNRGNNAGAGYLGAARNTAGIGISGAGMGQQAAMSDQMNAQGMLTSALGQGRSQDIGLRGQDIGIAQGNQNAQMQQYGLNTQRGLGYLGQQTGMDQSQLAAALAQYQTQKQTQQVMQGSSMNAAGGLLAMSDERSKTDISDAGSDIDDMLNNLVAKTYRYKNEARHGAGPRAGVMVQDLERSKAGRALVTEVPGEGGLRGFDVSKAVSAALASAARLNARLKKLEAKAG